MTDGDEQAVRNALAALDDAFARRDLDAAVELCAEDVLFIGSGDGEEARGRDAIIPMFTALAPNLEGLEFSRSSESIDVEFLGDVALLFATGPARLVTASRDLEFRYRLTGVLVRDGDRWLWRVFHGSEPGAW
jgi:uncharacterized protein (TIGR02246 family)